MSYLQSPFSGKRRWTEGFLSFTWDGSINYGVTLDPVIMKVVQIVCFVTVLGVVEVPFLVLRRMTTLYRSRVTVLYPPSTIYNSTGRNLLC